MRRPVSSWRVLIIGLLVAMTGCVPTQPFYLHEDGDLSHYIDHATQVEHPDLHTDMLAETTESLRPLSVSHPEFKEFWDLTLEECVAIALLNSKLASYLSASDRLRDAADAQALISKWELPLDFSKRLNPAVRSAYERIWRGQA